MIGSDNVVQAGWGAEVAFPGFEGMAQILPETFDSSEVEPCAASRSEGGFVKFGLATLLVAIGLSCATISRSAPLFLPDPAPENYLSIPDGTSEQAIVDAAIAMPSVAKAMQVFAGRGYARHYGSERAAASGDAVLVALGYDVPGRPEVGGLIWIVSSVEGGVPQTRVAGGLIELDPSTHLPVPSSMMSEPGHDGFVIGITSMASTAPSNYSLKGSREREIAEFVICAIGGMGVSAQGCGLLVAPPAVGTCTAVGSVIGAVGCAIGIFGH